MKVPTGPFFLSVKDMLGIMSDSHEQEEPIKKAVKLFKEEGCDLVIHCGDIISPLVLEHFKGLNVKFVFGNNDGEREFLNIKAKEHGLEEIKDEQIFEYENKKFYVNHGHRFVLKRMEDAIQSQKYDYILTGHTHHVRDETIGKTRIINPGALFRVNKKTVCLLDIKTDKLDFIEIK